MVSVFYYFTFQTICVTFRIFQIFVQKQHILFCYQNVRFLIRRSIYFRLFYFEHRFGNYLCYYKYRIVKVPSLFNNKLHQLRTNQNHLRFSKNVITDCFCGKVIEGFVLIFQTPCVRCQNTLNAQVIDIRLVALNIGMQVADVAPRKCYFACVSLTSERAFIAYYENGKISLLLRLYR